MPDTFGLAVYGPSGAPWWRTDTAADGCAVDIREVSAGAAGSVPYVGFAGRSIDFLVIASEYISSVNVDPGDYGVSTTVVSGYPELMYAARDYKRTIIVLVDY